MKGIILAGGKGTRLYPTTLALCKQLLPIFDKPMIYYPLSTLMLAGISEILIISTPEDTPIFQRLFQDGSHLGLKLSYEVQKKPEGLAQAFLIGKNFIGKDTVALILGDNIFHGHELGPLFTSCTFLKKGAIIFGYQVKDPHRYGVIVYKNNRAISLEEKPESPQSPFAVPGLYFYDNDVVHIAAAIQPSARGELEITDINRAYLERGDLQVKLLGRGFAWLDTGTLETFQQASHFVQVLQERQGLKIACIEEIAYYKGFITKEELYQIAVNYPTNDYGNYLLQIAKNSQAQEILDNESVSPLRFHQGHPLP